MEEMITLTEIKHRILDNNLVLTKEEAIDLFILVDGKNIEIDWSATPTLHISGLNVTFDIK